MTKQSFVDFVKVSTEKINFDSNNRCMVKEVIRQAIDYYDLKSTEKEGENEVLFLESAIEENILKKIAQIAMEDEEEGIIDLIYDGYVVRKH